MPGDSNQSRREFLINLGIIGAFAASIAGVLRGAILYIFPERKKKTYHKYLISKVGDIPIGKAKEVTLGGRPVFVANLEDGYKVFSGVCTHLGCIVRWEEQKSRFYCPCHQGIFSKTGEVVSGPPPRPLDEYQVEVEDKLVYIKVEDSVEGPWA